MSTYQFEDLLEDLLNKHEEVFDDQSGQALGERIVQRDQALEDVRNFVEDLQRELAQTKDDRDFDQAARLNQADRFRTKIAEQGEYIEDLKRQLATKEKHRQALWNDRRDLLEQLAKKDKALTSMEQMHELFKEKTEERSAYEYLYTQLSEINEDLRQKIAKKDEAIASHEKIRTDQARIIRRQRAEEEKLTERIMTERKEHHEALHRIEQESEKSPWGISTLIVLDEKALQVFTEAIRLFDSNTDAAREWLQAPAPALMMCRPIDLLGTRTGAEKVLDVIAALQHGTYL